MCVILYQNTQWYETKNKIDNKFSDIVYEITEKIKIYDVRQRAVNGGIHWCFISNPMMKIVEQVAPGYNC